MRIVQVTPRYPPAVGGMENYVRALSVGLRGRGHEVIIVTSDDMDNNQNLGKSVDVVDGIPVYRYPLLFRRMMREYWFLSGVTNALEGLHADVVHAHGYRCLSSYVTACWCRRHSVPLVLTPHGIYPPRSLANAWIKHIYDSTLGNLLLGSSDCIIALTENNRQLLLRIGASEDKIMIAPNGVDVEKYEISASDDRVKKRPELDGKVLLYVGRIDWNKGLDKVIEAMPLLVKEFDQTKLFIVGPDYAGYANTLLSLASRLKVRDSVIVTGKVSDEQVLFYYSIADVFVLPSMYEGLSTSLLEAMASRVPVIASRSGGSGDVLVDNSDALLLKDCSSQEIFALTRRLLRDNELSKRISDNAFTSVCGKYDWRIITDRIERLYRNLLN